MSITRRKFIASAISTGLALRWASLGATEKAPPVEETAWDAIREFLFQDRPIDENNPIAKITAPYRAQNAADVSIQINGLTPQTSEKYIKTHYLVADGNPSPVIGKFTLSPRNGSADIATRVRVDQYSYVRVISETQDGNLHMHKTYVKTSGGCATPPLSNNEMAELTMGKTRLVEEKQDNDLRKIHVSILHPNYSGLQRDASTSMAIPPHYVTDVAVTNSEKETVFRVDGDISFSENPSFEFYYKPSRDDDALLASVKDSKGRTYAGTRLILARL